MMGQLVASLSPFPLPHLGPRMVALLTWLLKHQDEIEAMDNGQLVIDWSAQHLKARLTRTMTIPVPSLD